MTGGEHFSPALLTARTRFDRVQAAFHHSKAVPETRSKSERNFPLSENTDYREDTVSVLDSLEVPPCAFASLKRQSIVLKEKL